MWRGNMGKYTKITFLLSIVLLASCSPVRRHARLIKRYPYLIQTDTVVLVDTLSILVPKVQTDTVMLLDSFIVALKDTIVIERDKLKVRITQIHDSIYIDAKCDTVYMDKIIERKIPVKYYETKNKFCIKTYIISMIAICLVLLMLYVIYKYAKLFK